jgi:disulfide oxidoreductase YuzD
MKNLFEMSASEIKSWLRYRLENKWSERDLEILSGVLFDEYQNNKRKQIRNRTDREYFAKMLIQGKIKKGIPPEK